MQEDAMSLTNGLDASDPVFEAKKILLAAVAQRDARIQQLENIIRSLGACVPVDTIAKFLQADGEVKPCKIIWTP
jgi:hypothetical protein